MGGFESPFDGFSQEMNRMHRMLEHSFDGFGGNNNSDHHGFHALGNSAAVPIGETKEFKSDEFSSKVMDQDCEGGSCH